MIENRIGLEAEYILRNSKGEVIMPPAGWDRDGFPVLGEIRAEPGKNTAEVIANFVKARLKTEQKMHNGHSISFEPATKIPLALYKKAMKVIRDSSDDKDALLSSIMNIYNTDISDFSDQIISEGKIQGCRASCGLHIHFSSEERVKATLDVSKYKAVNLPISMVDGKLKTEITLYSHEGYKEEKKVEVTASQLNRPTIEWIVKSMDDQFFERFAPKKDSRTKFRMPGFFELKPYGFEYRSLPASDKSIDSLVEIVDFAFELLRSLKRFDYRKF